MTKEEGVTMLLVNVYKYSRSLLAGSKMELNCYICGGATEKPRELAPLRRLQRRQEGDEMRYYLDVA